ncbi:MAG TPA: hypothetical protein VHC49_05395, partial [Mycobacteriales bacterium]|nr:hypothetical protein [Mycobacteriales bacterium]
EPGPGEVQGRLGVAAYLPWIAGGQAGEERFGIEVALDPFGGSRGVGAVPPGREAVAVVRIRRTAAVRCRRLVRADAAGVLNV